MEKGEVVITKIRQIRISQISGTILDRLIGKLSDSGVTQINKWIS